MTAESIQVVGAGLAGALLATYLARRGYAVDVFERRGDMRIEPVPRGRSINLALSTRGLHALDGIDLRDDVMRIALPMQGRMIHARDGTRTLQPYSIHPGERIYSVSRHALNCMLLDAAATHHRVRLHFHHKCRGVDFEAATLDFANEANGEAVRVPATRVIGTDGAYSAVRAQMQKRDRFDLEQRYLDWGYKELTMPALPGGGFRFENYALHIWPRHDFMLIALPNLDGSFTCTLFLPFEGRHGFAALHDDAAVTAFFEEQFPDAVAHMPTLLEDFRHNPTSSLVYVRCSPWHVDERAVLVGDACHAVVPFYGQGMNAAFEDCAVLDECVERHAPDWGAVFSAYQALRKANTDALADLSLRNFVEMRDKVVSPLFAVKKRAEQVLHRLMPHRFLPLYSMVTFSRIPYAEAVLRARRQDALLMGLGIAAACGAAALGVAGVAALRRRRP